MIKNRFICMLTSAIILIGMTACSFNIPDNSDVMRPPRATGNKAEIQDCIEKQTGGEYTLKYARTGDYRTSIIMKDLTGDGEEESVALYTGADKSAGINVSIMDEINGSWQTIASFSGAFAEVDRVFFCDLNGDGCDDILVGWGSYGLLPSQLTAYVRINGEYRESSVEQTYSELICGSFTGNNCDSIILFTLGSPDQAAKASLVTMNDQKDKLKIASEVDMNPNVVEFESITKGYVNKDNFGVIVDGRTSNNHCVTQVLYRDSSEKELVNPLVNNALMKREDGLISFDINHDGIVEIPVREKMPSEDEEQDALIDALMSWNVYDEKSNNLKSVMYTVHNDSGGYLFTLESDLYGKVTARNDNNGATMLYEWNTEAYTPEKGNLIFTVKRFTDEQWKNDKESKNYEKIKADGGYIYAVKFENQSNNIDENYEENNTADGNALSVPTLEDIKSGFILQEDISAR